jgi:hypothetical protein
MRLVGSTFDLVNSVIRIWQQLQQPGPRHLQVPAYLEGLRVVGKHLHVEGLLGRRLKRVPVEPVGHGAGFCLCDYQAHLGFRIKLNLAVSEPALHTEKNKTDYIYLCKLYLHIILTNISTIDGTYLIPSLLRIRTRIRIGIIFPDPNQAEMYKKYLSF